MTGARPRATPEGLDDVIRLMAKLPGLGPRSARRAVLHMLGRKDQLMAPLAAALAEAAERIGPCSVCGNLDVTDPCGLCADPTRTGDQICVVEQVGDLWALERTTAFRGRYHVLGGTLSALDGLGPEELRIPALVARVQDQRVAEVILALNATVDGQTTAHYIADALDGVDTKVTRLAHGVPMGGELDYLDDGTLLAALRARRDL